ncbi:MAG: hypothetical protein MJ250_00935 [Alphaproteobacteria bacterium]|nr:hypothetical protein [Alphaproteobacteria bacterium]
MSTNSIELTATQVKAFGKSSSDIYSESIDNARDIGNLRVNKTRLNLITTLNKKENEDWFSFKSFNDGKLRFSAINVSEIDDENKKKDVNALLDSNNEDAGEDIKAMFYGKGLRVEIYTKQGNRSNLIASNDEKNEKAFDAFKSMLDGEFKASKGQTYYVHVTTTDGKPSKEDTLYALQVQLGNKYTENYTVKEQAVDYENLSSAEIAQRQAEEQQSSLLTGYTGGLLSQQGADDILSDGYNNMATINSNKKGGSTIFDILI